MFTILILFSRHFVCLLFCRPQASSALFFQYNTQLGPPYHVIVDTNFVNFSIKNKLDIIQSMMDCLYAKCKLTVRIKINEISHIVLRICNWPVGLYLLLKIWAQYIHMEHQMMILTRGSIKFFGNVILIVLFVCLFVWVFFFVLLTRMSSLQGSARL